MRQSPEIPVGQFSVEALVEQLDVEDLLPGSVEGVEVVDRNPLRVDEVLESKGCENIDMTKVRNCEGNLADDGNLAKNVLDCIALVLSSVDDSNGNDRAIVGDMFNRAPLGFVSVFVGNRFSVSAGAWFELRELKVPVHFRSPQLSEVSL